MQRRRCHGASLPRNEFGMGAICATPHRRRIVPFRCRRDWRSRETSRGDEATHRCATADRQRFGNMPFWLPALGAKHLYAARSSWWPRRDTLSRTTRRDDNTQDNPGGGTTMCLSEPRLTQAAGRWKWRHVARNSASTTVDQRAVSRNRRRVTTLAERVRRVDRLAPDFVLAVCRMNDSSVFSMPNLVKGGIVLCRRYSSTLKPW